MTLTDVVTLLSVAMLFQSVMLYWDARTIKKLRKRIERLEARPSWMLDETKLKEKNFL